MTYSETRYVNDAQIAPARGAVGAWLAGGTIAAVLALGTYSLFQPTTLPPPLSSAHVKIVLPVGHGSATHIGDGLYITAAHVVDGHAEITINGAPAQVMWSNKEYDIALVRGSADAAFVPLACITPQVGDHGVAHGNPLGFEDITTNLTVAGEAGTIGHWKTAIPMDGNLGPGMSGGGFVMSGGYLAGVNVGAAMAPASGSLSYFGISIVVPASVVCSLLGRS